MTVIGIVVVAVLISMGLILLRLLSGPSLYDRILAVNAFGSKTMVLIALLSFTFNEPMLLDIALVYALVNFITTLCFLKYVRSRALGEG